MTLLQIVFGLGILGILGFIFYWFGILLKAGPEATKKKVNNDPRMNKG